MDAESRTNALWWADLVVEGTFFLMQTYLTQVWGLSFTAAAALLNIWGGIHRILPLFFLFLADTLLGNFRTLALSAIFSTTGLVFVTVIATTGYNCHNKREEAAESCVGDTDRALFIMGMALLALGRAARFACSKPFIDDQDLTNNDNDEIEITNHQEDPVPDQDNNDKNSAPISCWSMISFIVLMMSRGVWLIFVLMPAIAFFAFPYVKKWYLLWGVAAISTAFATLIFLYNYKEYKKPGRRADGSPITDFARVFVASALNISQPSPKLDDPRLHVATNDEEFKKLSNSRFLSFLHKAALKLDDSEGKKKRSWRLCSVSEVESAKILIRMVSIYSTYLICGVVSSIGNTYIVEQATHMDYRIGSWKPPLQLLQLIFIVTKLGISKRAYYNLDDGEEQFSPLGLGCTATIFSIICCTVAAAVERRRVHVVRRHSILDQPNDDISIPMSAFWLLFPYIFIGFVNGVVEYGHFRFHRDEAPKSMERYYDCLGEGVNGVGYMTGVLSVYVVGKVSESGSGKNWFQHSLNGSRLDRYYWALSVLASVSLILGLVICFNYRSKTQLTRRPAADDVEQTVATSK